MPQDITRSAHAHWSGTLKEGEGNVDTPNKALDNAYSFGSRFHDAAGTNPEELLAAAHAACFAMAFAQVAGERGLEVRGIDTNVKANLSKESNGYAIKDIAIKVSTDIPGVDQPTLDDLLDETHRRCIVSNALKSVPTVVRGAPAQPAR